MTFLIFFSSFLLFFLHFLLSTSDVMEGSNGQGDVLYRAINRKGWQKIYNTEKGNRIMVHGRVARHQEGELPGI